MTSNTDALLASIDSKLAALLALTLDNYVRVHEIKGARPRGIDTMLHDAGLSTADIAVLLGKTQRAVQIAVQGAPAGAPRKAGRRK